MCAQAYETSNYAIIAPHANVSSAMLMRRTNAVAPPSYAQQSAAHARKPSVSAPMKPLQLDNEQNSPHPGFPAKARRSSGSSSLETQLTNIKQAPALCPIHCEKCSPDQRHLNPQSCIQSFLTISLELEVQTRSCVVLAASSTSAGLTSEAPCCAALIGLTALSFTYIVSTVLRIMFSVGHCPDLHQKPLLYSALQAAGASIERGAGPCQGSGQQSCRCT